MKNEYSQNFFVKLRIVNKNYILMYQAFIILSTYRYMYILLYNVCRTKPDTKIIIYDANTISDNIYKFEHILG